MIKLTTGREEKGRLAVRAFELVQLAEQLVLDEQQRQGRRKRRKSGQRAPHRAQTARSNTRRRIYQAFVGNRVLQPGGLSGRRKRMTSA
jgi:hypothetical protein